MLRQGIKRSLPYRPEQLFDLAADVERYPEFLRWWIAAQIRKREGDAYDTDQILGLGPIRVRFESRTVLHRPEWIRVSSGQSPFRAFGLSWSFAPELPAGCRVGLAAEMEFTSRLLENIVARVLPAVVADIIVAFEARAQALYGPAPLAG